MTDRSPIAALAKKWRGYGKSKRESETAASQRGEYEHAAILETEADDWFNRAAELEAAIAAQAEAARNLTIEGCIRKLKGEP